MNENQENSTMAEEDEVYERVVALMTVNISRHITEEDVKWAFRKSIEMSEDQKGKNKIYVMVGSFEAIKNAHDYFENKYVEKKPSMETNRQLNDDKQEESLPIGNRNSSARERRHQVDAAEAHYKKATRHQSKQTSIGTPRGDENTMISPQSGAEAASSTIIDDLTHSMGNMTVHDNATKCTNESLKENKQDYMVNAGAKSLVPSFRNLSQTEQTTNTDVPDSCRSMPCSLQDSDNQTYISGSARGLPLGDKRNGEKELEAAQERLGEKPNKSIQHDLYTWLWVKHKSCKYLNKMTAKTNCSIKEIKSLPKVHLEIQSRLSTGQRAEEGVKEMIKELQEMLDWAFCENIVGKELEISYDKINVDISLPKDTYICESTGGSAVIVGLHASQIQAVELLTLDHDPEGEKNGAEIYKNKSEDSAKKRQLTEEKLISVDSAMWKYAKTFWNEELTDLCAKYEVKLKNKCHENGFYCITIMGEENRIEKAEKELGELISKRSDIIFVEIIDLKTYSIEKNAAKELAESLINKHKECIAYETEGNKIQLVGPKYDVKQLRQDVYLALQPFKTHSSTTRTRRLKTSADKSPMPMAKEFPETRTPTATTAARELPTTPGFTYCSLYGHRIHVFVGDITRLRVDAVVNASNKRLEHGGGVAGAILQACGPELQEECRIRVKEKGTLSTGQIFVSDAFSMPCKYIIHIAGPIWSDYYKASSQTELWLSFSRCLNEGEVKKLSSIALPAVGSGSHGAPVQDVAKEMHAAVCDYLRQCKSAAHLKDILLVDISARVIEQLNGHFQQDVQLGKLTVGSPFYNTFIVDNDVATLVNSNVQKGKSSSSTDTQIYSSTMHTQGAHNKRTSTYGSKHNDRDRTQGRHNSVSGSYADAARSSTRKSMRLSGSMENQTLGIKSQSNSMIGTPCTTDEPCVICMECDLKKVALACNHVFCTACIETWFKDKPTCPTCGKIYGIMKGTQPEGTITMTKISKRLPGHETSKGTLVIDYYFPSGTQTSKHPHPGRHYRGIRRTGYLPDNPEGREIQKLLKRAFDQKLVFTIGRSTTTGCDDQITWNDIHHKTNMYGGPAKFGYPDESYLSRVREELAAKGIN